MLEHRNIWQSWSRQLHKWGLAGVTENLLESLGGFDDIFLHIFYFIEPLVFGDRSSYNIKAFLALFDDEHARLNFLEILKDTDA